MWIRSNEIEDLDNNIFTHNNKLKELYISGNNIRFLSKKNLFSTLENLEKLQLWQNKIENLDSDLFKIIQSLKNCIWILTK